MRSDLRLVADAAADNWTFLERLQPDKQAVDFFHACEHLSDVADHAVTTDWYDKLSCVTTPMVKVGDPPSSRQGDDSDGAQGSRTRTQVFPEAQVPHALREPEGLHGQVLSANKVLVNQRMKRARWSMGTERPDLQGIDEVRPIRHGKQWSEQASRTTIRRPSQLDNGKFGNMRSTPRYPVPETKSLRESCVQGCRGGSRRLSERLAV